MLAILVPFRDREAHLKQFVPHMKQFLKIPYKIFLIEQTAGLPFNRGALLNIGFTLAKDQANYVCFHDIDMLPKSADYSFPTIPTHLATKVEQFNYTMPYPTYFGGVTLFNTSDFQKINGFSNGYWGWGREDEDLRIRCEHAHLPIERRDGIFISLSHPKVSEDDPDALANWDRFEEISYGTKNFHLDGLSSLHYDLIQGKDEKDLVHIIVNLSNGK